MKFYSCLVLFTLFFQSIIVGQGFNSDRPMYSISGEIIPEKTFAIEYGNSATFVKNNQYLFQYADLNLRLGMMKLMEMTVAINSPATLVKQNGDLTHKAGFASPKMGLKILMKEKEEGVKMGLAFTGGASLNFGSKNFKDTKILPAFQIAMDVDWTATTNMRINYGVIWLENRNIIDPEGNPVIDPFITISAVIHHRLNPKLSIFGEIFALVKHNNFKSDYQAHTGLVVHLKDYVQMDISGGAGLSPASNRGFISVGFSGLWPEKNRVQEVLESVDTPE